MTSKEEIITKQCNSCEEKFAMIITENHETCYECWSNETDEIFPTMEINEKYLMFVWAPIILFITLALCANFVK